MSSVHQYCPECMRLRSQLDAVKLDLLFLQYTCSVITSEAGGARLEDLRNRESIIERVHALYQSFSEQQNPLQAVGSALTRATCCHGELPSEETRLEVVVHAIAVEVFSHIDDVREAGHSVF